MHISMMFTTSLDAARQSWQSVLLVLCLMLPDSRERGGKKVWSAGLFLSLESSWSGKRKGTGPHLVTHQLSTVCSRLWCMQTVNDEYQGCCSAAQAGGQSLPGKIQQAGVTPPAHWFYFPGFKTENCVEGNKGTLGCDEAVSFSLDMTLQQKSLLFISVLFELISSPFSLSLLSLLTQASHLPDVSLCSLLSSSTLSQTLGLRSSLELRLANHPALAIVFQLEYVFSAPVGPETMVGEKQNESVTKVQTLLKWIWN